MPKQLSSLRQRLYRLQQRIAITAPEATVVFTLTGVLLLGLGVRHVEGQTVPVTAADYASLDAAFDAGSTVLRADAAAMDSVDAPAAPTVAEATAAIEAEAEPAAEPPPPPSQAEGPVRMNLNTAPARLLERLPRIGPALAGRIVAYRTEHGPFQRVEDVMAVRGIGPKTFEKLEPYLFVDTE